MAQSKEETVVIREISADYEDSCLIILTIVRYCNTLTIIEEFTLRIIESDRLNPFSTVVLYYFIFNPQLHEITIHLIDKHITNTIVFIGRDAGLFPLSRPADNSAILRCAKTASDNSN